MAPQQAVAAAGGLGLSHHPARPEPIEAQAEVLERQGRIALDVERVTRAAFDPAVASWDGMASAELRAAPEPIRREAGEVVKAVSWAGAPLRTWAGHIRAYNTEVDRLNAQYSAAGPHFGAVAAAGAAAPTEAAVDDARAGLRSALLAEHARAWEIHIVDGGQLAARMFDRGPTMANVRAAQAVGAMPASAVVYTALRGLWARDAGADTAALLRGYLARGEPVPGWLRLRLAGNGDSAAFGLGLATGFGARAGTPEQNAAWWRSLSPSAQQALITAAPAVVGSMNGVPAWARHKANESRLADEAARLDAEIARLRQSFPRNGGPGYEVAYHDELRRLEQLEAKRASITTIEQTLASGDRQLLVLDLSGDRARAAVAVGDVDTAEHVAVFTPGLGSTVDGSLGGYDEQMRHLRQQAEERAYRHGDGGSVATVTWIGYQAPQDYGESALAGQAEAGADELNGFYRGINASREADPHLTAIGHSYGSTTTGYAVQQPGGGVDDAVFIGSPGIGTSNVDDLNVPAGHTFVVEARWDYVADLGRFGADPNHMDGVSGLSAREETAGGQQLAETTGHSTGDANGYLANDTASQYNISTVVAGVPEQAVHDSGSGFGDALRFWLGGPP